MDLFVLLHLTSSVVVFVLVVVVDKSDDVSLLFGEENLSADLPIGAASELDVTAAIERDDAVNFELYVAAAGEHVDGALDPQGLEGFSATKRFQKS